MGLKYKIVKPPRTGRAAKEAVLQRQQEQQQQQQQDGSRKMRLRGEKARRSSLAESKPTTPTTTMTTTTTTTTTRPKKRVRIRSPSPSPSSSPEPIPRRQASLKASTLIKKDARRRLGSTRLFQSRIGEDGTVVAHPAHDEDEDHSAGEEAGGMGDTIVVAAPKLMLMLRAKRRANGGPRPAVVKRGGEESDSSSSSSSDGEVEEREVQPARKKRKIVVLRPPRRREETAAREAVVARPQPEETDGRPAGTMGGGGGQDKYTPPPTPPIKEALLVGQPAEEAVEGAQGEKTVVADWGCPSPPAEVEVDGDAPPWLDDGALHEEPGFFLEAFGDVTGLDDEGSLKKWKGDEEVAVAGEETVAEKGAAAVKEARVTAIPEEEEEEADEVDMVKMPESPLVDVPVPAVEEVGPNVAPSLQDNPKSIPESGPQVIPSVEIEGKDAEENVSPAVQETATLRPTSPIDDEEMLDDAASSDESDDHSVADTESGRGPNKGEELAVIQEARAPSPHLKSASATPEPVPIQPFSALTKATPPSSQTSSPCISPIQPFFHPLAKEPEAIDLAMAEDLPAPALGATVTGNVCEPPLLEPATTAQRRSSLPITTTKAPSTHRENSLPPSLSPLEKVLETFNPHEAAVRRQNCAAPKASEEVAGQNGRFVVTARQPAAGLPEEATAQPVSPPSRLSIAAPKSPPAAQREVQAPPPPIQSPPKTLHAPPPPAQLTATRTHQPPHQPTPPTLTSTSPPPQPFSLQKRKRGRPLKYGQKYATDSPRRRLIHPVPILPQTHHHRLPYQHQPPSPQQQQQQQQQQQRPLPIRAPAPGPRNQPPILLLPPASPVFPMTSSPWAYRRKPNTPPPPTQQAQGHAYLADKWLVSPPLPGGPLSAPVSPVSPSLSLSPSTSTHVRGAGDRERMPPPPLPVKARVVGPGSGVGATPAKDRSRGVRLPGLEALGEVRVLKWSGVLAPMLGCGGEVGEGERVSVGSLLNG